MEKTIVIFSMSGCLHCKSLKDKLNEISIPYMDIDIDANAEIWDSVVKQTKNNFVPTVFIKMNDNEDGPVYIPGKDFNSLEEIVDILKKI